jgi:uncharacterized glyoxalase superfamily protein PhnB
MDMTKGYTAPYINFQGRAREAMEFYHGILGGKLVLDAFDASGKMKVARASDPVGYGRLEADGFASSDLMATRRIRQRPAIPLLSHWPDPTRPP